MFMSMDSLSNSKHEHELSQPSFTLSEFSILILPAEIQTTFLARFSPAVLPQLQFQPSSSLSFPPEPQHSYFGPGSSALRHPSHQLGSNPSSWWCGVVGWLDIGSGPIFLVPLITCTH